MAFLLAIEALNIALLAFLPGVYGKGFILGLATPQGASIRFVCGELSDYC